MADNLFAICEPRSDVLQGVLKESDFAADLSQVLRGDAPDEYKKPELFFANTYPTKGLKNALKLVALRVLGRPEQVGAVFRLDTQFGGGGGEAAGACDREEVFELPEIHQRFRWWTGAAAGRPAMVSGRGARAAPAASLTRRRGRRP